ncbi:hypothetical protein DCAR_0831211 [Daucus carota subsp. sativus]|uniref:Uncharacterized protein n=1 Tax=Daucus carota subsp. sativus TaxID=79200 RepID=A0AAF1BA02_DAUCS|nr:hypothetical protein DCAR_0831211 [Daucus carota subsp. sativus]
MATFHRPFKKTVVPAAFAHLSSKGNRGKGDGKGKVVEENVKRKVDTQEDGTENGHDMEDDEGNENGQNMDDEAGNMDDDGGNMDGHYSDEDGSFNNTQLSP